MYGYLPPGFGQVEITNYTPIEYGPSESWGRGDRLKKLLGLISARQFEHLRSYQDRLEDRGRAELVTYFGSVLSRLVGLSDEDRQVVELACIFSNAGYSRMENLDERYQAAIADFFASGLKSEREHSGLTQIRLEHQCLGVEMVIEKMGMYPRTAEVALIVADHDTRLYKPNWLSAVMQDADMLYPVTLPYLLRQKPEEVVSSGFAAKQLGRLKLHLAVSRKIAELELQRALQLYLRQGDPAAAA